MSLTPKELEIQERCEKATLGPWFAKNSDGRQNARVEVEINGQTGAIATVWDRGKKNNRYFIAHAREDIPTLLSTVSALREEVERLEKALDQAIDYGGITWERVLEPTPTPEYVLERCPVGSDQRPAEVHPELATYLRTKEQP